MAVKKETKTASAWNFDVLRKPVITEKAAKISESNGVVFEVDNRATKNDVANAMKAIYNITPTKVNILNVKGKVKTFRGKSTGKQKTIKKAYVSMPADAKLEIA